MQMDKLWSRRGPPAGKQGKRRLVELSQQLQLIHVFTISYDRSCSSFMKRLVVSFPFFPLTHDYPPPTPISHYLSTLLKSVI